MSRHPNVILIITDDQGYGDLACHGNPVALTPNLDQLHAESIRLEDFHVSPMCTPTRGQLLTGLDAARNGALSVSSGRSLLRTDLPTLADRFRDAGYRTGIFGKWHLGDNYPYRPEDRGFEESLWFPSSHISSLPDYWENDYFDDVYCRNGQREPFTGYCTEVFFRETKAWIRERAAANEPFFAYLPTNAPHAPLWVPKEDREALEEYFTAHEDELEMRDFDDTHRTAIIRFLAMIRNLDTEIGQLRACLEELNIARDTILIFMTDNGSTLGHIYYNVGMRGSKTTLWEGGHRVPCFIHWPNGGLGEARSIDGLTQVQDLFPTLVDFCGLKPLEQCDGISLADALRGKTSPPEDRMLPVNYSRMPDTDYPTPDSKAVMKLDNAGMLWQRWRLLNRNELYNLEDDPHQDRNVIAEHPEIAAKMNDALEQWWAGVEALANTPQYIIVGSDRENPMMLSACEWRDVFIDQQRQVRIAEKRNSFWHLEVEQAGTYRFELRRWPRESGLKMRESCPETQVTDGVMLPGESIDIHAARIMIRGEMQGVEVGPDDDCAVFELMLEPGRINLHTWFDDVRKMPICGAYYVYVERKN